MLLQPLVVGLGRSGVGLHLKVLTKLLAEGGAAAPITAYDQRVEIGAALDGVTVVHSLEEAARRADPGCTVVHVCTPPDVRAPLVEALAYHGFRNILVEKPLATSESELADIERLRIRYQLRIAVVAHWLAAELTRRLVDRVRDGQLGELRAIHVEQHKPRFLRSLHDRGHDSAFDVEIPHSLGVVLRLAGPADLVSARCTDMRCGEVMIPRLGGAELVLRHHNGVVTEIRSDLTSPIQRRSIRLEFDNGAVTGHYPLSEVDDHAQLIDDSGRWVFRDDALLAFLRRTYRNFAAETEGDHDLALHVTAVRLLAQGKQRSAARDGAEDDHAA